MTNLASIQAFYVAFFASRGTKVIVIDTEAHAPIGNDPSMVFVDSLAFVVANHIEPEPCQAETHYEPDPLPRPPKTKLRIKEPRRQSFRQSMRSVNRNR